MDTMSRFDERDASEARSEINALKHQAMQYIQEMPDGAFLDWWEQHRVGMDDAATQAHTVAKARRFEFAAVTRGQEEPVCEEFPF